VVDDITINDAYGNLPLKGNWRYRPFDISTFTIMSGENRIICDVRRKGWVVAGFVTHNNPNLNLTIEIETGTETYINTFTADELFQIGLVQAQNTGWWISRYDTILDIYNVIFTPAAWLPFYKRIKVTLENKTAVPIVVNRVAVLCIEFTEEEK